MFEKLIEKATKAIEKKVHVLPVITVQATEDGYWAGTSARKMASIAQELYGLGTLCKANYIVTLEPYHQDSQIAELDIFDFDNLTWLATSCSMSLMNAQTGQIQVGHHQINHVESHSSSEMDITFIETKDARIAQFVQAVKKIMFNSDGTQNVPYHYLMRLSIGLFPRDTRSEVVSESYIVALQASSVELSASESSSIVEIPLTFTKMFPMMD